MVLGQTLFHCNPLTRLIRSAAELVRTDAFFHFSRTECKENRCGSRCSRLSARGKGRMPEAS
jgi:hypothetical protein